MSETVGRVDVEVHADTHHVGPEVRAGLNVVGQAIKNTFGKDSDPEVEGFFRRTSQRFRRLGTTIDRFGDRMGRAFGKGSRNDFFNIFGRFMGILPSLMGAATRAVGGFVGRIADMVDGFKELRSEGAGIFAALAKTGLQALGGALSSGVAGIAAMALAATVLVGALGPLVSMISLLAAAAIALTSAIAFGVVGALAAVIPLALGLAAGIGTIALAIGNMSDAQKKAFEPLKKQFTDIGKTVAEVFFQDIPKWTKFASDALKNFAGPLMTGVAAQVRDGITSILLAFSSPQFQAALKPWTETLPRIAGLLVESFGKVALALIAVFTPVLPYAERLALKIEEISNLFFDWATSAAGQNQIKDFMDKAWAAASTLWGVLTEVWGILQKLFFAGAPTGKSFLDTINEKLAEFNTWLGSDEGRDELKRWFEDAKVLAENLGGAIEAVGKFLVSLDTPENRRFAISIVAAFEAIMLAIDAFKPAILGIGAIFGVLAAIVGLAMIGILSSISLAANALAVFFRALAKIPGGKFEWANQVADGLDGIHDSADAATGKLAELPGKIQDIINKVNEVPGEKTIVFDGDTSHLQTATENGQTFVASVDAQHNTHFLGTTEGIEAAAAGANTGIRSVPPTHDTDFLGEKYQLQRTADESRGAIAGVPEQWWSNFYGRDGGVNRAAADARNNINTVPQVYTTAFTGDITALLAKIAVARGQISALMAQSNGLAMGNADLGQRAAGGIVGMANGSILKGPQIILAGEAGPEAIVPLRRDLNRVDPSVRWLSGIAQGLTPSGPSISPGAIQVTLTNSDPQQVASALLDRMVAVLH